MIVDFLGYTHKQRFVVIILKEMQHGARYIRNTLAFFVLAFVVCVYCRVYPNAKSVEC